MQSTPKNQKLEELSFSDVQVISALNPLRGKEAADAMRETLTKMNRLPIQEGITEEDVNRMVREVF